MQVPSFEAFALSKLEPRVGAPDRCRHATPRWGDVEALEITRSIYFSSHCSTLSLIVDEIHCLVVTRPAYASLA